MGRKQPVLHAGHALWPGPGERRIQTFAFVPCNKKRPRRILQGREQSLRGTTLFTAPCRARLSCRGRLFGLRQGTVTGATVAGSSFTRTTPRPSSARTPLPLFTGSGALCKSGGAPTLLFTVFLLLCSNCDVHYTDFPAFVKCRGALYNNAFRNFHWATWRTTECALSGGGTAL